LLLDFGQTLIHLQEPAFQRLIFITMLAWENPYHEELTNASEKASFQVLFFHHLFAKLFDVGQNLLIFSVKTKNRKNVKNNIGIALFD
jgi:hypothetical protein